jgi:hypothetical protein
LVSVLESLVPNNQKPPWYARLGIFCLGLGLLSLALGTLLKGASFYQNYWGGAVYAPIALIFGLLFLYGATFGWSSFLRRQTESQTRKRRKH